MFVKGALDIVIKSLWWIVRRDIFHSFSTVSHYEELKYKQRFFAAIQCYERFQKDDPKEVIKAIRREDCRREAESTNDLTQFFRSLCGPAVDGGVFVYAEGKQ